MSQCKLGLIFHHALEERNGLIGISFDKANPCVEEATHQIFVVLLQDVLNWAVASSVFPVSR